MATWLTAARARQAALSLFVALLACACRGGRDDAGLPLELMAYAVHDTVPAADALLIGWTVRNPGASRTFRDYAAFYRLTVIGPAGRVVPPEYDERGHAVSGDTARTLASGAEVRHVVNLACVPEPLEAATAAPSGCALRYRLDAPGAYRIVVQHVPLPPPDGARASEFLPSRPDTATLYVTGASARGR